MYAESIPMEKHHLARNISPITYKLHRDVKQYNVILKNNDERDHEVRDYNNALLKKLMKLMDITPGMKENQESQIYLVRRDTGNKWL